MIRAASIAVLAGTCLVSLAAAQEPAGKESGASVWRQACGGCHGAGSFNGQTLQTIRTLGEPRIRHALVDNDEEAHPPIQKLSDARLALLLDYLKPDADKSHDCDPASCPDDEQPARAAEKAAP